MRYWSSDWHLSHDNSIDFCGRPFYKDHTVHFALGDSVVQVPDAAAMNQALLDNCNELVGPDDELWLVGDLALGRFETSIQLFKQLRCRNLFQIPGNHDRNHRMHPKWRKWQPYYEAVGFTVLDSQVITTVADQPVKVCHFPYITTHHTDDRYSGLRPDDTGEWLIHGHLHSKTRYNREFKTIEVGVDAWNFAPVSESEIEKIILENG